MGFILNVINVISSFIKCMSIEETSLMLSFEYSLNLSLMNCPLTFSFMHKETYKKASKVIYSLAAHNNNILPAFGWNFKTRCINVIQKEFPLCLCVCVYFSGGFLIVMFEKISLFFSYLVLAPGSNQSCYRFWKQSATL